MSISVISEPQNSTDKTKDLTCYYWFNYGKCRFSDDVCGYAHELRDKIAEQPVVREPGKPAVAGRNARLPYPVYHDWQTERKRRAIPPAIAAQIRAIHDKQLAQQFSPFTIPSTPVSIFSPAPTVVYPPQPASTHKPIPPLTAEPKAFVPAAQLAAKASPPAVELPGTPTLNTNQGVSVPPIQTVAEMTQHLQYTHVELVEQCSEALKALTIFEEAYVKKEGWAVGALTPTERFRVAMGRILDVCEGHMALLEAHGQL